MLNLQRMKVFDMDNLIDVIKYLFINYPQKGELSIARLVKMVYLSDWKSCLLYGKQITSIQWYFSNFGPFVSEIVDSIRKDDDYTISLCTNQFGDKKELIQIKDNIKSPIISDKNKQILDFVINKTYILDWEKFICLVFSTYPIVKQCRYTKLDLPQLAREYLEELQIAANNN